MALSIKDIIKLPILSSFTQVAGYGGLSKVITSAGIADYEFASDIDIDNTAKFERDSIVISSLLFAKDEPEKIFYAVKYLYESGVSAFAYKPVIYKNLPKKVLTFANKNDFPIFYFGKDTWFENIIFDIMNAVEIDDSRYLSEKHIEQMIRGTVSKNEIERIRYGISLLLNKTISAAYVRTSETEANRIYRLYYVSKGLKDKVLVSKYDKGIFILITTNLNSSKSHRLILNGANNILSFSNSVENIILSRVHPSFELDLVFKEAYFSWIFGLISPKKNASYDMLGVYAPILALSETSELKDFSKNYLKNLTGYEDTIEAYIRNGGDIIATSIDLNCHSNTVRYRISKIKSLVGATDETDSELFRDLSIAYTVNKSTV